MMNLRRACDAEVFRLWDKHVHIADDVNNTCDCGARYHAFSRTWRGAPIPSAHDHAFSQTWRGAPIPSAHAHECSLPFDDHSPCRCACGARFIISAKGGAWL